jgi:23S rRNA (cytosine1962-C5)-methyltransferase
MNFTKSLNASFDWRKQLGLFSNTETLRIFYDPNSIAIDLFQEHAWITQWGSMKGTDLSDTVEFLKKLAPWGKKIESIVLMDRSKVASEKEVITLWGTPPNSRISVLENNIPYLIELNKGKHPGLFLDHYPLREWLKKSQKGKKVLNLFSYTGSLSVAAGVGGAAQVTTLDLSKSTIEWAEANWKNADLNPDQGRFIYGDVFEWLPKLIKRGEAFDTILCDPPSFSRSKSGVFSTNRDSQRLHELVLPLLKLHGVLVTSINSENYPESSFLRDIHLAAEKSGVTLMVLKRIDLPESFATSTHNLQERYLKGFHLIRIQ